MTPQELFNARDRGEKIEVNTRFGWNEWDGVSWHKHFEYRIVPKKELSLVEELRLADTQGRRAEDLLRRAADRIEELENQPQVQKLTTDELLAEIKRRMT